MRLEWSTPSCCGVRTSAECHCGGPCRMFQGYVECMRPSVTRRLHLWSTTLLDSKELTPLAHTPNDAKQKEAL